MDRLEADTFPADVASLILREPVSKKAALKSMKLDRLDLERAFIYLEKKVLSLEEDNQRLREELQNERNRSSQLMLQANQHAMLKMSMLPPQFTGMRPANMPFGHPPMYPVDQNSHMNQQ